VSVPLVAALLTASRTGSTQCTQKKVQPVEVICSLCVQFGQCHNSLCVPALKLGHPGPGDYLETRRNRSRARSSCSQALTCYLIVFYLQRPSQILSPVTDDHRHRDGHCRQIGSAQD